VTAAAIWADARRRAAGVDRAVVRWWAVTGGFVVFDYSLLFLLVGVAGLGTTLGYTIDVAASTVLRYLVTDRFVFGQTPSWRRFGQFVASTGTALVVWWVIATGLAWLGLHYLVAALVGSACSVGLNLVAHFRWIWRSRT
jgi:putative flippase GtrA